MKMTTRLWILAIFVVLSIIAINPTGYFKEGVQINTITAGSTVSLEGLEKGEIIKEINGKEITSIIDFNTVTEDLFSEIELVKWDIETTNNSFEYESLTIGLNIDENLTVTSVSQEAAEAGIGKGMFISKLNGEEIEDQTQLYTIKNKLEPKIRINLLTNKNQYVFFTSSLDLVVKAIPKTNLRAGLDISGGAKALIKPEGNLSDSEFNDLITITKERLNIFGLSDIVVRSVKDSPFPNANKFMLVEVAGSSPAELEELIGRQGKFEAKIGNETVFIGGKEDIKSVCRNDATCAGIRGGCPQTADGGYVCNFEFVIYLSPKAAERQAEITSTLSENITSSGGRYLSKPLDLYLDDNFVTSLQISASLKGKAVTNIAISGPGVGATQQEAFDAATSEMNHLQTVLVTGGLPVKLRIEKLDSVSSLLGEEFVKNILLTGIFAAIAVSLVIFIRYRDLKLVIPVILTLFAEILLILGAAAMIRWNLDLASIAGIIASVGTGVDHLVIIIDESRAQKIKYSLNERVKRAFFIIFGAFATTFVAMIPLWWAGAGIIRGFAVTTIIGISIGVFIARPAFASVIQQITKE